MRTLHGYILRELLKTFGLAQLALTGLFTMAGGLYNVMRYEGVTSSDIAGTLHITLPLVVTLTMPLAALFAAAQTYGRLAADNEFTAIRSAGVHVHGMFLAACVLAVFVSIFTTLFANYVIPELTKQLEHFARSNVSDIVEARLKSKGYVRRDEGRQPWFMTAESVEHVSDAEMARRGFPTGADFQYLLVGSPTLLELEEERVMRFLSARWGLIQFDSSTEQIKITGVVDDAREFVPGSRSVRLTRQTIGPMPWSFPLPSKPSFADLTRLFEWSREPWRFPEVAREIDHFRLLIARRMLAEDVVARIGRGETLRLLDAHQRVYEVTAERAQLDAKGEMAILSRARVLRPMESDAGPIRYETPRAELISRPAPIAASGAFAPERMISLELRLVDSADGPVLEYNPRSARPDAPSRKPTISLDAPLLPPEIAQRAAQIRPEDVVSAGAALPGGPALEDRRAGLRAKSEMTRRKVSALIHWRLGMSVSFLLTIPMGAALGVIFRGARMLAAFALSFVPFLTVAVVTLMGRQLAENDLTQMAGVTVIWSALGACLLADLAILRLGVRR
ncbi:MAG: hypothetical protein CHACPFDD_03232 [Phycisphaerae bacterium]|nr:hypothetical protein [Phycisphaerae bacterium]